MDLGLSTVRTRSVHSPRDRRRENALVLTFCDSFARSTRSASSPPCAAESSLRWVYTSTPSHSIAPPGVCTLQWCDRCPPRDRSTPTERRNRTTRVLGPAFSPRRVQTRTRTRNRVVRVRSRARRRRECCIPSFDRCIRVSRAVLCCNASRNARLDFRAGGSLAADATCGSDFETPPPPTRHFTTRHGDRTHVHHDQVRVRNATRARRDRERSTRARRRASRAATRRDATRRDGAIERRRMIGRMVGSIGPRETHSASNR